MAVDHKDDDDVDEDETGGPSRRIPKQLVARKSLPSVENALDDFIIAANQKPHDVTEFSADTREKQLRDEIADLKRQLTAAEARATDAPAVPVKRPWGAIAGAFVIGCAGMFAVMQLMKSDARPQGEPAATAPTAPAAPIAQPAPTPSAEPLSPAPTPVAAAPTLPTAALTPDADKPTAARPKQPKQPGPTRPRDGSAKQPSNPQPTPATGSGGGDLYNPF